VVRRGRTAGGRYLPGEDDYYARARREAKREVKQGMTAALRDGLPRWRSYDAPEWEPADRIEPKPEPAEEAPEAPKGNRFSGLDFA
jgi:hypothetical protein